MRTPRDLSTTLVGHFALTMMAYVQPWVDGINNTINGMDGLHGWMRLLFGAGGGAVDWYAAAPNAFDQLTTGIVQSLASHNFSIMWLVNYDVPKAYRGAQQYTNQVAGQIGGWVLSIQASILGQLYNAVNQINGAMANMQGFLLGQINSARADAFNYTTSRWLDARNYATVLYNQAIAYVIQEANALVTYINKTRDDLENRINLAVAALTASIAAAVAYITLVFVPAEIAASVAAQNALATEAMAVPWEAMATKANLNLAQWAIMDPGLTWATDPTPEIPPVGIALGLGELVNWTRRSIDVEANTLIPLYRNLHKFGEDLASLEGVITTLLGAGFEVAAITAPETTAALVADVLGGPLNAIGTGIVNALLG